MALFTRATYALSPTGNVEELNARVSAVGLLEPGVVAG